jgi:hypothetical protein
MKSTLLCALLTTALGCASANPPQAPASGMGVGAGSVPQGTPLGFLVGRSVLILPVQHHLLFNDSTLKVPTTGPIDYSASLDNAIETALTNRGLGSGWTFASAISATARRNTGMVPDPHELAIGTLTRLTKAGDDPLPQGLASQIRSLVALRDGRYAALPAAVRFSRGPTGDRATLVLYLIDSRTARIVWSGEVSSDPSPLLSAAMSQSIGERVADLVVGR